MRSALTVQRRRLAFGVWRLAFGVWRLALGAAQEPPIDRANKHRILERIDSSFKPLEVPRTKYKHRQTFLMQPPSS
ncbi:MAG TPA: hypothetical protein VI114_03145, partial [Chthoniobacterales bacterium]